MNPLKQLETCGQSPWLDYLKRSLVAKGELRDMIKRDGLKGVTSNPSIFEKAIGETDEYADAIAQFQAQGDHSVSAIYEHLAIADIRAAADILRPIYDQTEGRDGYISLECSPYLANDTEATVDEALRLWTAVERPNLMVKVPATPAGIPAIRRLIGRGLNINITLLFSVPVYEQVVDAYIQRDVAHTQALTAIRAQIRNRTRAATCLGFGPRFQHSTGQAYKGGPNTGVFLQITCDDPVDIDVPGHSYSFGAVKAAQARGDLEVLVERGRRALRVHLSDVEAGLAELARAIDTALQ
jgi:hypothetical protein